MKNRVQFFLLVCLLSFGPNLHGQEPTPRIMRQDSTLNNLVDPPDYKPARLGTLGGVIRMGNGSQDMILIPGLGFGGSILNELMRALGDNFRMYAVTIPGFGGTAAPACPDEATSFGEQTWTTGALTGIEKLIEEEKITHPIIVGHWLTGTQLALRLAIKYPQNIKAIVLLSGSAKMMVADSVYERYYGTLERRVSAIDRWLAPRWFKTVTRETWDDNNFLPGDYAVNPVLGLRLWREAASPKLHVWIRYLCEFNAQDISFEMHKVTTPTLLLRPDLKGLSEHPDQGYMFDYCHRSWVGSIEDNPRIISKTIPNSRICIWLDNPSEVRKAMLDFLAGLE